MSFRDVDYDAYKSKNIELVDTANKQIQVELDMIEQDFKPVPSKPNERYQRNPDFVVSQSIDFDPNLNEKDDFHSLKEDMNNIKQSLEFIRLEQAKAQNFQYPERDQNDYPHSPEKYKINNEPEDVNFRGDTSPVYDAKSRKSNYMKKRLADLKNVYKDGLDELIDESDSQFNY